MQRKRSTTVHCHWSGEHCSSKIVFDERKSLTYLLGNDISHAIWGRGLLGSATGSGRLENGNFWTTGSPSVTFGCVVVDNKSVADLEGMAVVITGSGEG